MKKTMKAIKIIPLFMIITIMVFGLCGCTEGRAKKMDEDKINGFFDSYLEQFNYSEKDWDEVDNIMKEAVEYNNDKPYMDKFEHYGKYMTKEGFDRLKKYRLVPNFAMRDVNVKEYKILDMEKISDNVYEVELSLKGDKINEKVKVEVTMKGSADERGIDSFNFDNFNRALNQNEGI